MQWKPLEGEFYVLKYMGKEFRRHKSNRLVVMAHFRGIALGVKGEGISGAWGLEEVKWDQGKERTKHMFFILACSADWMVLLCHETRMSECISHWGMRENNQEYCMYIITSRFLSVSINIYLLLMPIRTNLEDREKVRAININFEVID